MNSKILGLLATGLLVQTSAHAAAVTYDFNSTNGGFTPSTPVFFPTPWTWSSATGSWLVLQTGAEVGFPMTTFLTSPNIVVGGGVSTISFVHRWSLEAGNWDGAGVRYSVNGGGFTYVASNCFSANGYNGTVLANSASVLANQAAFVLDSPNFTTPSFVTSTIGCLGFSAGDTLRLQFLYAGDTNTRGSFLPSWQIDSVTIDGIQEPPSVPEPGTLALLGLGLLGLGVTRRKAA